MDVGQAALDAVVVVGELFVVDAEQVEQGGMEVVPGNRAGGMPSGIWATLGM